MSNASEGVRAQACPWCGYQIDSASCIGDPSARPKKGDFTICLSCERLLQFRGDGSLERVEDSDAPAELQSELMRIRLAMRGAKRLYRRRN